MLDIPQLIVLLVVTHALKVTMHLSLHLHNAIHAKLDSMQALKELLIAHHVHQVIMQVKKVQKIADLALQENTLPVKLTLTAHLVMQETMLKTLLVIIVNLVNQGLTLKMTVPHPVTTVLLVHTQPEVL
jgi:hypothetical protein